MVTVAAPLSTFLPANDSILQVTQLSGIAAFQEKERDRTGIKSLKVAYNRVFGYYIEITNVYRDSVPPEYERKQTLVNSERYITPELKEYESKVLGAEEEIVALEATLFEVG